MTLSIEDYRRFSLLKVQSPRLEPHEQDAKCIVHGKGVCFSSAELTD